MTLTLFLPAKLCHQDVSKSIGWCLPGILSWEQSVCLFNQHFYNSIRETNNPLFLKTKRLLLVVLFKIKKQTVFKQSVCLNGKDAGGQTGWVKGKLQSIIRGKGHDTIENEKCGVKFHKV